MAKLSDILEPMAASIYAGYAHRGQTRKFSGMPYIKHPRRVQKQLKKFGIDDPDVLAAAVLHDTIEDTGVTRKSIETYFNKRVADMVAWLSNPSDEKKWKHIKRLMKEAPYEVVLIKVFDRIDNLNDNPNPKFLERYKSTSDIIRSGLKKRGFNRLYQEYMKTYSKYYENDNA